MKKFLTILIAGFIGFLGIFTTTSTAKNSAEPQYFLQNERKNAIVETITNEYNVYLDTPSTFEYKVIYLFEEVDFSNQINRFYYYDINKNKINFNFNDLGLNNTQITLYFESDDYNAFALEDINKIMGFSIYDPESQKWYLTSEFNTEILGFGFYVENYEVNIENLNLMLEPYIGNLTSLESENTTIEQIGNIISDTTNWFVNIFIGLSDIFYSNGSLGVWGAVLFLGVAFTLITMCLKWVISLIRGI